MTHQRTTSTLAFIARPGALQVAWAIAAVRLGTAGMLALHPGNSARMCACSCRRSACLGSG
jgi:hypothetical protein